MEVTDVMANVIKSLEESILISFRFAPVHFRSVCSTKFIFYLLNYIKVKKNVDVISSDSAFKEVWVRI